MGEIKVGSGQKTEESGPGFSFQPNPFDQAIQRSLNQTDAWPNQLYPYDIQPTNLAQDGVALDVKLDTLGRVQFGSRWQVRRRLIAGRELIYAHYPSRNKSELYIHTFDDNENPDSRFVFETIAGKVLKHFIVPPWLEPSPHFSRELEEHEIVELAVFMAQPENQNAYLDHLVLLNQQEQELLQANAHELSKRPSIRELRVPLLAVVGET